MAKGYSARGGFTGGTGMMRQQQQMQQKLLKMQQDMAKAQEEVENRSFTSSVGGGAVQATVNGKKELTGRLVSFTDEAFALEVGKETVTVARKACSLIRPHIDF